MTDYNKLHNAQSIAWEWGQGVTDAETAIRKLHKLFPIDAEIAEKVEPVAWMWLEGTELMNGTDVEQFERVEFSREKPDEDAYGLTPLYTAPLSGVRAGMLRAAEICKEWEAKLSQGAGYAIRTAREAITSAADQVNEDSYSAGVDRDRAAGIYRDTVPVDQVNESQPETVQAVKEDAPVMKAWKKDPVDLVKAESKYGGYVTKENPVVSAQFAMKLAIQIDELNNQLAKFEAKADVYRTRIINAIHMLDAGHTKKQVRLHLSIIHDETMMEAK